MERSQKSSRRVPEEQAATFEEVERAIEGLSDDEERRLLLKARTRVSVIGRAALRRDEEDLLQEAITATLDGTRRGDGRRWNKNVSFFQHLVGAMRSISSHWLEALDEQEASLESDLQRQDEEGNIINPMLNVRAPTPNAERELIAKEQVARVREVVAPRDLAVLIVDGMREEMNGPEIKDLLEISQTQYETEMKWIRRSLRSDAQKRGSYV
jgi:hypothetical protein